MTSTLLATELLGALFGFAPIPVKPTPMPDQAPAVEAKPAGKEMVFCVLIQGREYHGSAPLVWVSADGKQVTMRGSLTTPAEIKVGPTPGNRTWAKARGREIVLTLGDGSFSIQDSLPVP